MDRQTPHAHEFDETVRSYNEWLASLGNSRVQRHNGRHAFFQGMASVLELDIFRASSTDQFKRRHPLYSRKDLTPSQKDAAALASDWQRVDRTLDEILSGDRPNSDLSVEDAARGKQLVRQMYEHFREACKAIFI